MRSEANEERLRCACVVAVSFICLLFCSGSNSFAQDKALRKINWGMTALSAAMWIPWLAKEARIYEKNGLDVDIVLLRGSGQSSQALLGGSLFAAPVALPQVMLADLNGADLVNVAHTIAVASSKLVVKPEIRKPEDLRGKKIATSSIGSLGIFCFATHCANTVSIQTAKLPGSPSGRTLSGSRRCSRAPSTAPTSPILPTCRPSARDTVC